MTSAISGGVVSLDDIRVIRQLGLRCRHAARGLGYSRKTHFKGITQVQGQIILQYVFLDRIVCMGTSGCVHRDQWPRD